MSDQAKSFKLFISTYQLFAFVFFEMIAHLEVRVPGKSKTLLKAQVAGTLCAAPTDDRPSLFLGAVHRVPAAASRCFTFSEE